MNFARNAASVLATSAVSIPLALLNSVVLARWLSVDDRGVYAMAMQVVGLTVTLSQLGWSAASVYRIRRVGSDPAEVLAAGVGAMALVSGVLLVGTLLFFDEFRHTIMPGVTLGIVAITLGMVPTQLLNRTVNGVARAIDRFDIVNWAQIAGRLGGTIVVLVVLVGFGGGVFEALAALLVWSMLVLLGRFVFVVRDTGLRLRFDRRELRDGFRFGLKSWMQSLAGQVHERVDVLMLAWLLGDDAQRVIAVYAVAAGVAQFLKLVPESISAALFPKLAGIADGEAGHYAAKVCRHVFVWVVVSSIGLAVVGPFALPLVYGAPYAASVVPFLILLPGVGGLTLYRVLSRYFVSRDRQGVIIAIQGVSVVLNVTLNMHLIPIYGAAGCAAASLASYLCEAVAISIVFRRMTGASFTEMFIVKGEEIRHHRAQVVARLKKRGRR